MGGLKKYSSSPPVLLERKDDRLVRIGGSSAGLHIKKPKKIYRKESKIRVVEKPRQNATGSLVGSRSHFIRLYLEPELWALGRVLNIRLVRSAANQTEDSEDNPPVQGEEDNKDKAIDLDELAKDFPNLGFKESKTQVVQKNFIPMEIVEVHPNGDLVLNYRRESSSMASQNFLNINALFPNEKKNETGIVLSSDLQFIEFSQVSDSEEIIRKSTTWEDEFSLRYNGFSEATSSEALKIAQKRRELELYAQKVRQEVKNLGNQRRSMAKERDSLVEDRKSDRKKIKILNEKVAEQKQTIAEQKEQLDDFQNPEEKPGDQAEGAEGD